MTSQLITGRLWVQLISQATFVALMQHKGYKIRSLGEASKVNRSTVGHLHSGKRDTCSSVNAKLLAKTLGVPVDALFRTQVSSVAPDTRPARTRTAA